MATYKKLTNVEHVLHRPDMYIGSVITETDTKWVCEGDKVFEKKVETNPGFIKLFDEIISNSADEHKRNNKLNSIKVTVDLRDDSIIVQDNGGIPVKKHDEYPGYIPEMIFCEMFAGTNFNDSEERVTVGTNGLGSTLVNIYSTKFVVTTHDKSKLFVQEYKDNMSVKGEPKVTNNKLKQGYTIIEYHPDLSRFKMKSIDEDHVLQLRKRCLDVAASNPGLNVALKVIDVDNKSIINTYKFKDFNEYVKFYIDDLTDVFYISNNRADIAIVASERGFYHKSFVNSVDTFGGGTHIRQIENQIIDFTRDHIKKKTKYDIKPSDVKNHFGIFVNCLVTNPRFKGQTKEILSTAAKDLGCDLTIPDKILKQIVKSDITAAIMDWVDKKKAAEEKAEMRKLNKQIGGALPINLLDAKSKKRDNTRLYVMEGKSAMSAVRKLRDTKLHGCYPLRGKFMNVLEKTNADVIQNAIVKDLVKSIGLKLGEDAFQMKPESGKKIKLVLDDGVIIVDENEEIFYKGKWVQAKRLLAQLPKVKNAPEPTKLNIKIKTQKVKGGDTVKKPNVRVIEPKKIGPDNASASGVVCKTKKLF